MTVKRNLHSTTQQHAPPSSCNINWALVAITITSLLYATMRDSSCVVLNPTSPSNPSSSNFLTKSAFSVFSAPPIGKEWHERVVNRTEQSGEYWGRGSWGRIRLTSSGCWVLPSLHAYAIECRAGQVMRRQTLLVELEHLDSLQPTKLLVNGEACNKQNGLAAAEGGGGSSSPACGIETSDPSRDEVVKNGKQRQKQDAQRGFVQRDVFVKTRVVLPASSCLAEGGWRKATFNFTCIVTFDILYHSLLPDKAPPPVCFASIGDWGSASSAQKSVATMLASLGKHRPLKFILSTGDNFYPAGVLSVADPKWLDVFENRFSSEGVKNVPWVIVLGNHDQWGAIPQIEYSVEHPRWHLPTYQFGESIPLYHDARKQSNETMEFFVLNTAGSSLDRQVEMLSSFFDGIDDRGGKQYDRSRHWRLVSGHEPLYSGGLHGLIYERNTYLRTNIEGALRNYRVHAYFNGDDHFLEIHRAGQTDFFTSGGGGGSDPYNTIRRPTTKWNMYSPTVAEVLPSSAVGKEANGAADGAAAAVVVEADGGAAAAKASSYGAMLHCIQGGVMTTTIVNETRHVVHVYETTYEDHTQTDKADD